MIHFVIISHKWEICKFAKNSEYINNNLNAFNELTQYLFFSFLLFFKNDPVIIQHHPILLISSDKNSSMSRTLVYRTNKEFDKCGEVLRKILSVQGRIENFNLKYVFYDDKIKESCRHAKSSIIHETSRKKPQQSPVNTRSKNQNTKIPVTKSSFVKSSMFIKSNKNKSSVTRKRYPILFSEINGTTETRVHRPLYSLNNASYSKNRITIEVRLC